MKRSNKSVGSYDAFRVHAPKRLVYDAGEWHLKTSRSKKPAKPCPLDLPVGFLVDALSLIADTLEFCLVIQDVILAPVYSDLLVGCDLLQSAQGEIIYAIAECIASVLSYEESVRITVEVVLGRKLPYECPQDHACMSGDVCSYCGMTLQAFSLICALECDTPKVADSGLFQGLSVHVGRDVEQLGVAGTGLDPVAPALTPLPVEAVEE